MDNIIRPKGLTILSVFTFLAAIIGIPKLFNADSSFILFGFLFEGMHYDILQSIIILINIVLAIGIFKIHRWSYYGFLYFNAFFIIAFIFNILLVNNDILIRAGWDNQNDIVHRFRMVDIGSIIIVLLYSSWIYHYRQFFIKRPNKG